MGLLKMPIFMKHSQRRKRKMRLYRMELYKLYHNKIFRIGLFAATALLLAYFLFAEVGGE